MDYKQEMIDKLRDLVAINSVQDDPKPNAPFGEGPRKALDYALSLCSSLGFKVKDVDGYCGWAEIGNGELFGVLAHLDTVPFSTEGWKCDPLSGEILDGEIYGRGVVDDKGPFINALYAVKALVDEGKIPNKRIRFILGCNEETEWRCIDRYLLTEEIPSQAISPDGDYPVINCEKGLGHFEISVPRPECLIELKAGERVNMVPDKAYCVIDKVSDVAVAYALNHDVEVKRENGGWKVSATGRAAHGSTPFLGDNALIKVLNTIASSDDELAFFARAFESYDGSSMGIGFSDEASGNLTVTVGYGKIEDGLLKFGLDIRFPISYSHDDVFNGLKKAFPKAEVVLKHAHPCLYFPKDHPFVQTLLSAYTEVTGEKDAQPQTIGGATYARAIPNTLAFGPVFPFRDNLCHQVNERVSLEDFEKNFLILKKAFEKLCFES